MAEPPFKQLRLSNFFCSIRNMSNANDRHDQNDSTSNRQGDTRNSSTVYEASSSAEGLLLEGTVRLPRPHPHQLRQAIVQVSVTSPPHPLTLDWLLENSFCRTCV